NLRLADTHRGWILRSISSHPHLLADLDRFLGDALADQIIRRYTFHHVHDHLPGSFVLRFDVRVNMRIPEIDLFYRPFKGNLLGRVKLRRYRMVSKYRHR